MKYAHDPSRSMTPSQRGQPGRIPAPFSIVPLLLADEEISTEARRALLENRLVDAARVLIRQHGLTCTEAGDLLDVSAC